MVFKLLPVYVFTGLGNGLSATWWLSQHNRHHAMPQRVERDVDLRTSPLIVFNTKAVKDPKKENNFFVRNQVEFLTIKIYSIAKNMQSLQ